MFFSLGGVDLGVLVAGFTGHPGCRNPKRVTVPEGLLAFRPEVAVGAPARTGGERRVELLDQSL